MNNNKLRKIAGDDDADLKNMQLIKEKLYEVLVTAYNKVDEIITENTKFHEDRFYSPKDANDFLINEYRPKLRNKGYETKIIVGFRDACEKAEDKEGLDFIDYISTEMTPLMSLYCSVEHINENENYVKQIIEMLTSYEIVKRATANNNSYFSVKKATAKKDSPFSVLEWATIFYYANEDKYLGKAPSIALMIEKFINLHSIKTTATSFRQKYYEASRRINKECSYPVKKLHKITPFLATHYPETVTKVSHDIEIITEEKADLE